MAVSLDRRERMDVVWRLTSGPHRLDLPRSVFFCLHLRPPRPLKRCDLALRCRRDGALGFRFEYSVRESMKARTWKRFSLDSQRVRSALYLLRAESRTIAPTLAHVLDAGNTASTVITVSEKFSGLWCRIKKILPTHGHFALSNPLDLAFGHLQELN